MLYNLHTVIDLNRIRKVKYHDVFYPLKQHNTCSGNESLL